MAYPDQDDFSGLAGECSFSVDHSFRHQGEVIGTSRDSPSLAIDLVLEFEAAAENEEVAVMIAVVMPAAPISGLGAGQPEPAVFGGERFLSSNTGCLLTRMQPAVVGGDHLRLLSHVSLSWSPDRTLRRDLVDGVAHWRKRILRAARDLERYASHSEVGSVN